MIELYVIHSNKRRCPSLMAARLPRVVYPAEAQIQETKRCFFCGGTIIGVCAAAAAAALLRFSKIRTFCFVTLGKSNDVGFGKSVIVCPSYCIKDGKQMGIFSQRPESLIFGNTCFVPYTFLPSNADSLF